MTFLPREKQPDFQLRSEWHNGERVLRVVAVPKERVFPQLVSYALLAATIFIAICLGLSAAERQYEVIDQINQESMHHGE